MHEGRNFGDVRGRARLFAVEDDLPGRVLEVASENVQEGGLASPRGPQDREEAAGVVDPADVSQHVPRALLLPRKRLLAPAGRGEAPAAHAQREADVVDGDLHAVAVAGGLLAVEHDVVREAAALAAAEALGGAVAIPGQRSPAVVAVGRRVERASARVVAVALLVVGVLAPGRGAPVVVVRLRFRLGVPRAVGVELGEDARRALARVL
mmetsp:Transcript_28408/g.59936  ORF Transcript_28408/g.59936 Transcript_28408/m.59936 type:complete len:209 (+) Transcript_28408:1656-2282(+)